MTLNGLPSALRHETIWLDAHRYQDAERQYYERQAQEKLSSKKLHNGLTGNESKLEKGKPISSIATEIAHAREKIKKMLTGDSNADINSVQFSERLQVMEEQSKRMNKKIEEMCSKLQHVESIMEDIVQRMKVKEAVITKLSETSIETSHKETADDDDIDLFGSDEETEEDIRIREERLKAYENKKSKKPALVAKSSVVLDVKPWDDEVDMKQLEDAVRKIEVDGLKWGASKLVPVAYGVQKLQIIAIVEDDKVSIELLQESIEANEDYVQSVDIAAFNKL